MLASQNSAPTTLRFGFLSVIKHIGQSFLLATVVFSVIGCAPMPTVSRTVSFPPVVKPGDVVEIAIDVAREMKFPPATKIDKVNGLVEFGSFGAPMMGITAQVRVKSEGQLETTVTRGSVYVPLSPDKTADEFKSKIEQRLQALGEKAAK